MTGETEEKRPSSKLLEVIEKLWNIMFIRGVLGGITVLAFAEQVTAFSRLENLRAVLAFITLWNDHLAALSQALSWLQRWS